MNVIDSSTLEGFHSCTESPSCIELRGAVFNREAFERISVGPGLPPDRQVRIIDCKFLNCRVRGSVVFRGGIELRHVAFESLIGKSAIMISTHALLDRVSFKGTMHGLWVRPDERFDDDRTFQRAAWVEEQSASIECGIDLCDAQFSDAEIIGYPVEKIRFDPLRYAVIRGGSVKVSELCSRGLSPDGFVVEAVRRIKTYGVSVGLFSYPQEHARAYGEAREEVDALDEILGSV